MMPHENTRLFLCKTWEIVQSATIPCMLEYLEKPAWDPVQTSGMGMMLGDIYKAVEQSLRMIVENIEKHSILKDESWHENLLALSEELGLIPEDIRSTLRGMLKYRHRLHHGYGVQLDEVFIRKHAPEAIKAFGCFTGHIAARYPELFTEDGTT